jgi:putative glutamine amidotransferase
MKWLVTYPEDGRSVSYYINWLTRGGVDALMIPPSFQRPLDTADCEALLLPGGGDVDPARYGESARHAETSDVLPARDELELALIREFLASKRPVFGICRGVQILNVALGGRLIQHVPDFIAGRLEETHRMGDRYDAVHAVSFDSASKLGRALRGVTQVNSSHHQAVHPAFTGKGLKVTAVTPAGVVEAVESAELGAPVLAVQWHPERMDPQDPASAGLLDLMKDLAG